MTRTSRALGASLLTAALGVAPLLAVPAASGEPGPARAAAAGGREGRAPEVRFATFNASLNRASEGELVADLSTPDDTQAAAVAEVVQRVRPDVLLVNEFDHDDAGEAADLFRENYLEVRQGPAGDRSRAIRYPYAFTAPSNTGVASGFDLDNDGFVGGGNDAYGFGDFEGQYGMLVLSRYPIAQRQVRTFQDVLWKDVPGARLPDDPATEAPADWFTPQELDVVRLSSKSHWDVPVRVGRKTVHYLVSHPTPPTFDGAEDRNGLRNADEIRFWADYVRPGRRGDWMVDDQGREGGLAAGTAFVVAGDQNSDPNDGDSVPGAIQQLLDHRRITDPMPGSAGAREASRLQGGANLEHESAPRYDTADFNDDPAPGNLRADYVLPRRSMKVTGSGVFWPRRADPLSRLTGTFPFPTSDHRAVWVDLLP